ncbi:beta-alanine-activating enzyme-like [Dreissena polymorpha]|uniref:Carrier domain-containing protein n=1 Tax=Dreissena polymorpha TaxID=45954 RepID=A0A9D4FVY3_DREPO|nr:beta-alanine-activating enzyme-like [Dreissena polymorpha]KAH3802907.1 hypothetical protein DPMN_156604 [Dreissena polymorpha]
MENTTCFKITGPVYDVNGVTLHSLVEEAVAKHAENDCVICDKGTTRTCLTYSHLWDLVLKVEHELSPFVIKGEVVSLCLKVDERMPAVLIGILKMGMAFYNFDAKSCCFSTEITSQLGSRVVIVHQDFEKNVAEALAQKEMVFEQHTVHDNDLHDLSVFVIKERERKFYDCGLAYCITTSGTTGRPKVIQVPHSCIVPNILHLRKIFNLTPADLVLCATTLTFDPMIVEIFTTLSSGASLLVVSPDKKMNASLLLDTIVRNKVTVMQVTPSLLYSGNLFALLGHNSCLRVLALGGEQFPSTEWLAKNRDSKNRTQLVNLYGVTEVSCWAMYYVVTEEDIRENNKIPLGKPLANTEVEIVSVQETGEKMFGQVFISGNGRQCVIGEDPHSQFSDVSNRGVNTGDFVEIQGDNWYFCGRKDSQLKRNGHRINLLEIKNVALSCQNITACEVLHIKRWQKIVVFVMLLDGVHNNTREVVLRHMHGRLPSYSLPDDVHIVQEIPVTEHGKADIRLLEKLYCTLKTKKLEDGDLVEYLASAWMDLLEVNEYHLIVSNFVLDGGDSIKAVQLANELEAKLKRRLPFLMGILMNQTFQQVKQYVIAAARNGDKDLCEYEKTDSPETKEKFVHTFPGNENDLFDSAENKTNMVSRQVTSTIVMNESDTGFVRGYKDNISEINAVVELHFTNIDQRKIEEKVGSNETSNSSFSGEVNEKFSASSLKRKKLNQNKPEDKYLFENVDIARDDTNHQLHAKSEESSTSEAVINLDRSDFKHFSNISTIEAASKNGVKRTKCSDPFLVSISGGNKIHFLQPAFDLGVNDNFVRNIMEHICIEKNNHEEVSSQRIEKVRIQLKLVWKHDMKKCVDASPVIAIGKHRSVVFVGSHSYMFSAIELHTGNILWSLTFPYRIMEQAALSVCGTKIIVCCVDGYVYVLDSHSGAILWQFNTGSALQCAPTVDYVSGHVFVRNFNDVYVCLDVKEYREVWRVSLPDLPGKTSGAVSHCPHQVYFTSSRYGVVFPLDSDNGWVLWQYKIGIPVLVSPVVSSRGVLVACTDGQLYHITHSGELIWKTRVCNTGRISSPPSLEISDLGLAIGNNRTLSKIFIGTHNDNNKTDSSIVVINAENGCIETSRSILSGIPTYVFPYTLRIGCVRKNIDKTCTQGRTTEDNCTTHDKKINIVLFTDTHGMNITSASTFDILCQVGGFQKEIWSSPVLYDNFVVFGCRDNHVYCYKISASQTE